MSEVIYHWHHIIPRHMGGTDDPSNLVRLTVEQHAEAHRKLYEEHGRVQDLWAWKGLTGMMSKQEIILEVYRENGRRWGLSWKGRKHTEETKQKIREITTGVRQSEETRNKKRKSVTKPDDFADKIRETRKSTTNFPKGVIAYGVEYKSIRSAAKAVGYSHTNVRQFCLDENNHDFSFLGQSL